MPLIGASFLEPLWYETFEFQTHVRFWDCNPDTSHSRGVSCVCGFVAKDGQDLVKVDLCRKQPNRKRKNVSNRKSTVPDLEAWSLAEGRSSEVNISTARDGNIIFVSRNISSKNSVHRIFRWHLIGQIHYWSN